MRKKVIKLGEQNRDKIENNSLNYEKKVINLGEQNRDKIENKFIKL